MGGALNLGSDGPTLLMGTLRVKPGGSSGIGGAPDSAPLIIFNSSIGKGVIFAGRFSVNILPFHILLNSSTVEVTSFPLSIYFTFPSFISVTIT